MTALGDVDSTAPKVTGTTAGSKHALDVALQSGSGPLSGVIWDYLDASGVGTATETYVFKNGGVGGDVVRTIVITYTGSDFIVEVS